MAVVTQLCKDHGIGADRSGEKHVMWYNRLEPMVTNVKTPVMIAHGLFGDADYFTEYFTLGAVDPIMVDLAKQIGMRRPTIATDMGGLSTWGNDTCITACGQSLTYIGSRLKTRTDRVVLVGVSMGCLTVLNWARANLSKVAAIGLFLPAVNLTDLHDNNRQPEPGIENAINGAYGGLSGYQAAVATHDPALFTASYAGIPIRMWYSGDDTTCDPTVVTNFGTAVGATMTNIGNVGHTSTGIDTSDAAAWLTQYS